jgi:hypothetical protein
MPVRAGLLITAVAVLAVLAACGSVAAPVAGGPHARTGSPQPAPATATATATLAPPAGSRAGAARLARLMLSGLRLPAGARRPVPLPVPQSLSRPALWASSSNSLDVHRLFGLSQPMNSALLAVSVPAGLSRSGSGQGSGPGGAAVSEVSYTARRVPEGIYSAQLVLTAVPDASGGSLVRADAQVIWFPPRTTAEYIDPERYHAVTITITTLSPRQRTIRRVVTSQAVIRQLAGALDRSPADPVTSSGCAMIFATYRLAFALSPHGPATIVASATRWPCGGVRVSAAGRLQPPLEDAGAVVAAADQLLGVTPRP